MAWRFLLAKFVVALHFMRFRPTVLHQDKTDVSGGGFRALRPLLCSMLPDPFHLFFEIR